MGSKKGSKETLLHTCAHHLDFRSVVANVVLLEDSIEIRCYEPRSKEMWTQKLSLCHVSAMIQRYHFDLHMLWDLLARSMQLYGDDLSFSTQHIIYYDVVTASSGSKALHVYQSPKEINGETWIVDFYSEFDYPFVLEISVKRFATSDARLTYRVESTAIKHFFTKYLEMYTHKSNKTIKLLGDDITTDQIAHQNAARLSESNEAQDDNDGTTASLTDLDKVTNHMLNAIMDDLIYDDANDKLLVRCMELTKLEDYLIESVYNNAVRQLLPTEEEEKRQQYIQFLNETGQKGSHLAQLTTDDLANSDQWTDLNTTPSDTTYNTNNNTTYTTYNNSAVNTPSAALTNKSNHGGGHFFGPSADSVMETIAELNEYNLKALTIGTAAVSNDNPKFNSTSPHSRKQYNKRSSITSGSISSHLALRNYDENQDTYSTANSSYNNNMHDIDEDIGSSDKLNKDKQGLIIHRVARRSHFDKNDLRNDLRKSSIVSTATTVTNATTTSVTAATGGSVVNASVSTQQERGTNKLSDSPTRVIVSPHTSLSTSAPTTNNVAKTTARQQPFQSLSTSTLDEVILNLPNIIRETAIQVNQNIKPPAIIIEKLLINDSIIAEQESYEKMKQQNAAQLQQINAKHSMHKLELSLQAMAISADDTNNNINSSTNNNTSDRYVNKLLQTVTNADSISISADNTPTTTARKKERQKSVRFADIGDIANSVQEAVSRSGLSVLNEITEANNEKVSPESQQQSVDGVTATVSLIGKSRRPQMTTTSNDNNSGSHSNSDINIDTNNDNNTEAGTKVVKLADTITRTSFTGTDVSSIITTPACLARQKYLITIDIEKENAKKMELLYNENKALIKQSMKQATIMLKNPLNETVMSPMNRINSGIKSSEKDSAIDTKYFLVREALLLRPERRSEISINTIIDMFKNNSELYHYIHYCAPADLLAIVNSSTVKDYTKSEVIATCGDAINYVYILLKGDLTITLRDYTIVDNNDVSSSNGSDKKSGYNSSGGGVNSNGSRRSVSKIKWGKELTSYVCRPGDLLGDVLMKGLHQWNMDASTYQSTEDKPLSLCVIPAETILRYIGRGGNEARDYVICFWKYTRLFHTLQRYNRDFMVSSMNSSNSRRGISNEHNMIMNVIDSARIRTFQAGVNIFKQGERRSHFYLITAGNCCYVRHLPEWINGYAPDERADATTNAANTLTTETTAFINRKNNAAGRNSSGNYNNNSGNSNSNNNNNTNCKFTEIELPTEIDTGIHLTSGDFSFLDSENEDYIATLSALDEALMKAKAESQLIYEHKKKHYSRFELHKNSLYTMTRTEVITIPLTEIVKCMALLKGLLVLSNTKYPELLTPTDAILGTYYANKQWEIEKQDVIKQIFIDKEGSKLNEEFYVNYHSYLSLDFVQDHKPGNVRQSDFYGSDKMKNQYSGNAVENEKQSTPRVDYISQNIMNAEFNIHKPENNHINNSKKRPQSAPLTSRSLESDRSSNQNATYITATNNKNENNKHNAPNKLVFGYGLNNNTANDTTERTHQHTPKPPAQSKPSKHINQRSTDSLGCAVSSHSTAHKLNSGRPSNHQRPQSASAIIRNKVPDLNFSNISTAADSDKRAEHTTTTTPVVVNNQQTIQNATENNSVRPTSAPVNNRRTITNISLLQVMKATTFAANHPTAGNNNSHHTNHTHDNSYDVSHTHEHYNQQNTSPVGNSHHSERIYSSSPPSTARTKSPRPQSASSVNSARLTKQKNDVKTPEFYIELYKERLVANDPKKRFIDQLLESRTAEETKKMKLPAKLMHLL